MLNSHRTALTVIVAMTPLAIGGVRQDVQLICGIMVAIVALLAVFDGRLKSLRPHWVGWALFVPAVWALIQLVPLPIGLLSTLSPSAADLYLAIDPSIGWAPLTVDATRTSSAAIHQTSFALVFLVVLTSGRSVAPQFRWAVIGGATACAVLGLIHWLFDASKIYGLYASIHRESLTGFFGPFVNENTLASLLVLGCLLSCGKILSSKTETNTRWALVCAFVCGTGVVATGSRGGALSLVLGWILFAGLAFKGSSSDRPMLATRVYRLLAVGSALLLIGTISSFLLVDSWQAIWDGGLLEDPKVKVWQGAWPVIENYWSFGSGRGTFGLVFHQHQSVPVHGTISHAENYFVQSLAESGLLATIVFVFIFIVLWFTTMRIAISRSRPSAWASIAGVTAVCIHQLGDFGMESMGLSFAVATVLGTLLSSHRTPESVTVPKRILSLASIVVVGIACLSGSNVLESQSDGHLTTLKSEPLETLEELAQEMAISHPADPMIPLVTAAKLDEGTPRELTDMLKWSAHAQRLAPRESVPHLVLARSLARNGRYAQASGEYRRALANSPWNSLSLLREVAEVIPEPQHLSRLVRGDETAERRLVESLFSLGRPDSVRAVSEDFILWDPHHRNAPVFIARACLTLKDRECVYRQLTHLKQTKRPLLALGLGARIEAQSGQMENASRFIQEGRASGGNENPIFLRHAILVSLKTKDADTARQCLDLLWKLSDGRTDEAIEALVLRGRVETQFGKLTTAIHAYEQAYNLRPSLSLALAAGRLELKTSKFSSARRRLEEAKRQWPQNNDINALLERLNTLQKRGHPIQGDRGD